MLLVNLLPNIHGHKDLIALTEQQRKDLCEEIREFLVSHISQTGGHLASNLGVVELSLAIETVFDTQKDRLVFDVGHQSYVHKMLTGRQDGFVGLRQFGGMAGFPKPSESETDAFVAGHASDSVSISLGMARARTLLGEKYKVVTVLGDGAATGGMAYEGLNDAGVSGEPMVVILNDNAMSIDRNVGGMASHLRNLRTKEKYLGIKKRYKSFLRRIPGGKWLYRISGATKDKLRKVLLPTNIFENMGFTYLGPVDGHDTEHLIALLRSAVERDRPVLLHVITQKGMGYQPAQEHPKLFHGVGKFDPESGKMLKSPTLTYSDAFGKAMVQLGKTNANLCAITAAMPGGTGLLDFQKAYPNRLFDVGIAEEHAVSMAGGLAKQGMVPVVALYSTFLQRSYDMILQDVCMQGLHVVFAVDRAGLVGEDGETHHGVFDVGFLRQAPGLHLLCPGCIQELEQMLIWAVECYDGPVAIRYPRGGDDGAVESAWIGEDRPEIDCHRVGQDVTILTYGTLTKQALLAAKLLEEKGVQATVLRLLRLDVLPVAEIVKQMSQSRHLVILEETCCNSGIKETLSWELRKLRDCRIDGIDLGKQYVTHGSIDALYTHYGLDGRSVAEYILEVRSREN